MHGREHISSYGSWPQWLPKEYAVAGATPGRSRCREGGGCRAQGAARACCGLESALQQDGRFSLPPRERPVLVALFRLLAVLEVLLFFDDCQELTPVEVIPSARGWSRRERERWLTQGIWGCEVGGGLDPHGYPSGEWDCGEKTGREGDAQV